MYYLLFMFVLFFVSLVINLFISSFISKFFLVDFLDHGFLKYFFQIFIYMIFYYYFRLLTRRMISSNQAYMILKANFISMMVIFSLTFLLKESDNYSRLSIILFFLINTFIPIYVYIFKRYFLQFSIFRENILVICDNTGQEQVSKWFAKDNSFGFDIKKVINIETKSIDEIKKEIKSSLLSNDFHAAVIDLSEKKIRKTFFFVDIVQKHISRVVILPKLSKIPMFNGEIINSINHKGMAFFIKNNLLNPVDKRIKTIFDYIVSYSSVLILSPFFILLYCLVYMDTKGKPLFKQRRIGQNGKSFNIYKFRTMVINSDEVLQELLDNNPEIREEWEKDFKLKDDPRITKLGNFLRKTSLDELPQLINVLQGKMSLVGPRPIIDKEIPKYGEYFEYFKAVKPGITGLWQVSGRNDIDYDERVQLDVWYVRNWSVDIDFIILIKTIVVVLSRKGSY
ncbi:undecaprenyl-phosphate galactose phosphotransferase WbaP [Arcobacter sp. s6]|uniref:undecaprenyl-phosphate galactose phosphotransferase WbaP n=1 Tax=Arcobacter sp. s6 TaxID=3230363 RepID=UPI0034A02911